MSDYLRARDALLAVRDIPGGQGLACLLADQIGDLSQHGAMVGSTLQAEMLSKAWDESQHPRSHEHGHEGEFAHVPWPWADDETRFAVQEDSPTGQPWAALMPAREKAAIDHYRKGGYEILNAKLRDGAPLTSDETLERDALRAAIESAGEYPLDRRPVVWRGVKMGPTLRFGESETLASRAALEERLAAWAREHFKPSDTVELGGFQSTSFGPLPALNAALGRDAPGVIFEIRAKNGAPTWELPSRLDDEFELLLDDQTTYRVLKVLPAVKFESTDYGDTVDRVVVQLEQL